MIIMIIKMAHLLLELIPNNIINIFFIVLREFPRGKYLEQLKNHKGGINL